MSVLVSITHGKEEILNMEVNEDEVDQVMESLHEHPTLNNLKLNEVTVCIKRSFTSLR